jgi:predicted acetyltransferase
MKDLDEIALVPPTEEFEIEFLAMMDELRAGGGERYRVIYQAASRDFAAYVRFLEDRSSGRGYVPEFVRETTYWLVRKGGPMLGSSRIRHRLTRALEHEGGHIGYEIRPSERRKGYGTHLLALSLEKAQQLGHGRVLVTCDSDNLGSVGVIEKNGGQLENQVVSHASGKLVSRYWIDLQSA